VAFSCVGLLFRRERLEEILNVLPEGRQREIRECLAEISGRSAVELGKQLKALRHADMMEAARRCGSDGHAYLEPLPPPLERWLHGRAWESNGREDY
jgi:hypothetical protein